MDDAIASGAWQLDPETRASLRLAQTQRALERGDYALAVIEAEELLDEEPHHSDALFFLAEALLALGDAEGAEDAFSQHLEHCDRPAAAALSGLAIARFQTARFQGAIEAAREALRLAPDHAESHYYLGLALERLSRKGEAVLCFAAAYQLDPASFPYPLELDDKQLLSAVAQAAARLPDRFRTFWSGVPVQIEEEPDVEELRSSPLGIPPTVSGLYMGEPDPERPERRPAGLRLFRRNVARGGSWDVVVDHLEAMLEHEAIGWMGLTPDELDELL